MLFTGKTNDYEPVLFSPSCLAQLSEFFLSHVTSHVILENVVKVLQVLGKQTYINGSNNERVVSNAFVNHFSSIYSTSYNDLDAKRDFDVLCASIADDNSNKANLISIVNVESVDRCIRKLKLGKASGPGGLSSEHLVNAHPLLVIFHLCSLFRGIILHGFVSDAFAFGIIVPLMKDKTGNANSLNNYKGITLIPVISKLFEILLLDYFEYVLLTDDLQFVFKKGLMLL